MDRTARHAGGETVGGPVVAKDWASLPLTPVQRAGAIAAILAFGAVAWAVPGSIGGIVLACITAIYLGHSVFFFTIWLAGARNEARHTLRHSDAELPVYTIIVPLYREASMAAGILSALARLDYPTVQLDVLLAVEVDDSETRDALARLQLPHWARVVIVPEGHPRTKPRACNHALAEARGEFVVIFDAEDRPEPSQLREAIANFDIHGSSVVCLQARLIPFNARETWVSHMFALDYCQWFDWTLPGLQRLTLPIPLGGTSNHFRRDALVKCGAWDPFNVTEDADLGVRLERLGYGTRTFASTTFEEAPLRVVPWLRQRTRWTKGYIQTFFVHARASSRLGLPALRPMSAFFLVFFIGGSVAFALLNPVFWAIFLAHLVTGRLADVFDDGFSPTLAALISMAVGNALAIARAMISPLRRAWPWLVPWGLLVPLYWFLLSMAAYAAVYEFIRRPFAWNKTTHGVTRIIVGDAT